MYLLEPLGGVEARTGLVDAWQVAVAHNLGIGIVGAEALQQALHRLLLRRCARVGGATLGVETTLVAHTNAVGIVVAGVGAYLGFGTTRIYYAVARDVVVVADGLKTTSLVTGL